MSMGYTGTKIGEYFEKKLRTKNQKSEIYFNYILSIGVKDDDQKKLKRKSLKKSENKKLSNIIKKIKKHILTTLYQWSLHEWSQKLKYKKIKFEKNWKKLIKKFGKN